MVALFFYLENKRVALELSKIEKVKRRKPLSDRHFTIIVSSYNSSDVCKKTLSSILEQTYKNFSVIYVNDGSTDNTASVLQEFTENSPSSKITILHNKKRKGGVQNLYEKVYPLQEEEVVLFLKGDSWLPDKNFLQALNEKYKGYEVWALYMPCKKVTDKEPKKIQFPCFYPTSLRRAEIQDPLVVSFYAGLFHKIRLQDLFFRGKIIEESHDEAYLFPLLEMAQNHAAFLPLLGAKSVYKKVADESHPCFLARRDCLQKIKKTPPYKPLKKEPFEKLSFYTGADLLVFSYDRPLQLYAFLESCQKHVKGIKEIFVLYRSSKERFEKGYALVQKNFPNVSYVRQSNLPHLDFHPLVQKILFEKSQSPYLFFSVDDILVKDAFDVKEAIYHLEKTKAYSFSFRLGENITYCYMGGFFASVPYHLSLEETIMAWQVNSARGDWTYPNSLDMTLYRKEDIKQTLSSLFFKNPNQMEWNWHTAKNIKKARKEWIGLSYSFSKAVNLPLNLVNISENKNMNLFTTEELLEKFEKGFSMDIDSLYQIENNSVHMEYVPHFVPFKKAS